MRAVWSQQPCVTSSRCCNVQTVGKDASAESNMCMACQDTENILHLAECPIIKQEFWESVLGVVIATLQKMQGMKQPQHTVRLHHPSAKPQGRIDNDKVIDKYMAGVMFLAWRCLYAELTRAPGLQAALQLYEGTGNMTITRLAADCVRSVLEVDGRNTANMDE